MIDFKKCFDSNPWSEKASYLVELKNDLSIYGTLHSALTSSDLTENVHIFSLYLIDSLVLIFLEGEKFSCLPQIWHITCGLA
jgi:hypothetical protein